MKKNLITILSLSFFLAAQAQESSSAFSFLSLPTSAHAAALGGDNITIIEDDLTMATLNPALLSCVADKSLNLGYTVYMDGAGIASAAYSQIAGERSAWAVTAMYAGYGDLKETTADNITLGTFSAKDMLFTGIYSYDLSDYWSGGVSTKLIYSSYEKYSSFAIGVDLGLNYYDQSSDFSASLVVKNLGGQLVAFDQVRERLPVDVQLGISKRLSHAPFRLSVTMSRLTDWSASPRLSSEEEKFGTTLLNHFVLGLDFIPTNNFYLSLGYNCQRASEMKVGGSSGWAGTTFGAGIQVKRLKFGASFAKYHTSSSSLLFNLAMTL